MRGKETQEVIRVQVIAALLGGVGVSETARRYRLPRRTVCRLKQEIAEELAQVGADRRSKVDDLLYDTLCTHMKALNRMAQECSTTEYLNRQTAGDIAALHTALSDTVFRLLAILCPFAP